VLENTTSGEGVTHGMIGTYSSLIENGYHDYCGKTTDSENKNNVVIYTGKGLSTPKLTIYGGKFTGGKNTIENGYGGELTIYDGMFTNYYRSVLSNTNVATIYGGNFNLEKAKAEDSALTYYTDDEAACIINKGYVYKGNTCSQADNSNKDISRASGMLVVSGSSFATSIDGVTHGALVMKGDASIQKCGCVIYDLTVGSSANSLSVANSSTDGDVTTKSSITISFSGAAGTDSISAAAKDPSYVTYKVIGSDDAALTKYPTTS
jgi:hypothetical protein